MNKQITDMRASGTKMPDTWRRRLPFALLAAFLVPLTYIFYGILEIYANNISEFEFALTDIIGQIILISLAVFALLSAVLLCLRGRAFDLAFAVVFWLGAMGFLQGMFLNFGATSLMADGVGSKTPTALVAVDTVIWIVTLAGAVLAVLLLKKYRSTVFTVATVLLVMMIAIQAVNSVVLSLTTDAFRPHIIADAGEDPDGTGETQTEQKTMVLTVENQYTVSSGKNVFVIVLDRFDAKFADEVRSSDPAFFDRLDGFTYYRDNLSTHSRTYPAIATMISGMDTDFTRTADEYFKDAYTNSEFLHILADRDYSVNLYLEKFYAYRNADEMGDFVDNVSRATSYTLSKPWSLVRNLVGFSTYRAVPILCKPVYTLSTSSFTGFVRFDSDYLTYDPQDDVFYNGLVESGLTVGDRQNTFSFYHLDGCHPPFYLGENADYIGGDSTHMSSTKGCFTIIYEFIDQLKELGLYESSTIVITGDHADPIDDRAYIADVRQTALFFKRSGDCGTPLAYSDAQVCQKSLIPSILNSVGYEHYTDFGKCYWEIPEDVDQVREYRFTMNSPDTLHAKIAVYTVTGPGGNIRNWKRVSEYEIGNLYK